MEQRYKNFEPGEPQYSKEEILSEKPVNAVYRKPLLAIDEGNPYIEALPAARSEEEMFSAYNVGIPGFRQEKQRKLSLAEKYEAVGMLRQVRFLLPFHFELESLFSMALKTSYRNRRQRMLPKGAEITVADETDSTPSVLVGNSAAAANAGLTLLGYSGCGKSAALEILLSHYPQVIYHQSEEMERFVQIVYIVVVCPANSNFKSLYVSAGAAIDRALGNTSPVYETMIAKCKTIGEKANKLCDLITRFGIGAIIFDEIQLLDFRANKESTFESLLEIVNKTKVALVAVGTEDAYQKMFPNLRTSRRTGILIPANSYCKDKGFFSAIVKELMRYQWFDTYVEPSQEIIDALYAVSRGIIDQLISVYMAVHLEYFRTTPRPAVDYEFIVDVANSYYPEIQRILWSLDTPAAEEAYNQMIEDSKAAIDVLLPPAPMCPAERIQKKYGDAETEVQRTVRDNVIQNIMITAKTNGDVYIMNHIENAVDYVMGLKKNANATEQELSAAAYARLKKGSSDKRRGPKKKASEDAMHIEIRNHLLNMD